jgi:hypothetical protein
MCQNPTAIPDILLIVDDDTSVDVEKMKQLMLIKGTMTFLSLEHPAHLK